MIMKYLKMLINLFFKKKRSYTIKISWQKKKSLSDGVLDMLTLNEKLNVGETLIF